MNTPLRPERTPAVERQVTLIAEHLFEVISDRGKGAQRCVQSLAALEDELVRFTVWPEAKVARDLAP